MRLIFIHGWSVTHTNNYRDLPDSVISAAEAKGLKLELQHVFLGKYISFHDEVSMDDIARALNQALLDLPGNESGIQPFSCVTHSTGGPVVRYWLNKYYAEGELANAPLAHLVMLAPANQGSSLAALGQKRVGRIKSWFGGIEPGQRVLDWLKLGSNGQYQLNKASIAFNYSNQGIYPFVIAGQGIDTRGYDFLNSYLVENGSDGIVRVAGANMNCQFLALQQTDKALKKQAKAPLSLVQTQPNGLVESVKIPLLVMNDASHAHGRMGLLNSKKSAAVHAKIADNIVQCLEVTQPSEYQQLSQRWQVKTEQEQTEIPVGKKQTISRYGMLVFRVQDNAGDVIKSDDYDVLLLAGKDYSANALPEGFFVDRQVNNDSNALIYYVDIDKMLKIKNGLFGIAIHARPESGFSYYRKAEFRASQEQLKQLFCPNQTLYIDITLNRYVDKNVFRFSSAAETQASFKGVRPANDTVD